MDEANGKLMGAHGYCTQEMVNLLLGGRAVSNVFNDTVTLEGAPGEKSTVLQGVSKRSDVGLLSLFEHYKSCQVIDHIYVNMCHQDYSLFSPFWLCAPPVGNWSIQASSPMGDSSNPWVSVHALGHNLGKSKSA